MQKVIDYDTEMNHHSSEINGHLNVIKNLPVLDVFKKINQPRFTIKY